MSVPRPDEDATGGVTPSAAGPRRAGYDAAFRAEAVARARAPGARLTAVAAELGVSPSTLRRWVRDASQARAPATDAHSEPSTDPREPPPVPPPEWAEDTGSEPCPEPRPEPPDRRSEPTPSRSDAHDERPQAAHHDESHVIAMLDAILAMFPQTESPAAASELSEPSPAAWRATEAPTDRIPLHPGDDIFPATARLLPAYRFPIVLVGLVAAVLLSQLVPEDYPLRPVAVALHVLSLVVSFGAVLVVDWHGALWLAGRRGLTESARLAAAAGPLIWGGLAGLIVSGALLHPNLSSPLTVTKLVLVLLVAWNGAAMSALRRRLAQLPSYVTPRDLPRRDWRLMMTATAISQAGWWGAILIGFVNAST